MEVTEKPGVQELYLAIMEQASFNGFDGEAVAASLREHRDLWKSAIMVESGGECYTLRDLPSGYVNLDTLYVLTSNTDDADALAVIADSEWHGEEISVLPDGKAERLLGEGSAYLSGKVLRVWWD